MAKKVPDTQLPPPAPDPYRIIEEQARYNRANEIGPSGYTTNYQDPNTGVWTQQRVMSDPLKDLYNQQLGLLYNPPETDYSLLGQAGETYGKRFGEVEGTPFRNFAQQGQELEAATFNRGRSLLDQPFANREQDLRTRLANQGIMEGSEAYGRSMDEFGRDRNKAYEDLALSSVGAGRQEQGRLFGQTVAQRQQLGQEGQGAFGQLMGGARTLYGLDAEQQQSRFNQLAALLGGQQVARPSPLDVTGPFNQQYQGQLNTVNAINQGNQAAAATTNDTAATAAKLGTLLYLYSSRTFKRDQTPISHAKILEGVEALDVERWVYRDEIKDKIDDQAPHIGPYAEDFQTLFGVGDGIHIHPIDAIGVCLSALKALTARVRELERD